MWNMGWYYWGGKEVMKRWDLSLDKNCDREVQLRICAGRLFHAVGADIKNELSTQRRRELGKNRHTVRRRSTWSTSAYQSPTSLLGSISDPPVDDSWSFRDTGCKRMADGLSLLLARRPGTNYLTIQASSALEVLRECAIQIYLLT